MVIEISLGAGGAASVNNFQLNYNSFITNTESIISGFKAIKRDTYNLSGDVGNLQNALDDIETRICHEEEKKNEALNIQRKTNDFLSLAQRVDNQVADLVNQHNEEFYKTNPWARPNALLDDASSWIENAWEWICNLGNEIEKGIRSINAFLDEHSFEILITVCSFALCFAFPAAAPWILGASGALLSAVSSVKSQLKEKDKVDWETVFQEALIGGVVGATTAWLGAGIGNAITKTLTTKFLSTSASTLTRVLISGTVGAVSETGSGIITRGVASATENFIKTGEVQFEDVTQEAFDLKQMLLDSFFGSIIGGVTEYNYSKTLQPIDSTQISLTENQQYVSDTIDSLNAGLPDTIDKEMVLAGAEVKKMRIPKTETSAGELKGTWKNSTFYMDDDFVPKYKNDRSLTVAEIKQQLSEAYGIQVDGIPFEDGVADFSNISIASISTKDIVMKSTGMSEFEFDTMEPLEKTKKFSEVFSKNKRKSNFSLADQIAAERQIPIPGLAPGYTATELADWRKGKFSWDEQVKGGYNLIPTIIHGNISHTGLVSSSDMALTYFKIRANDDPTKCSWQDQDAPISLFDLLEKKQ